jgi:hypothetical protein
MAAAAVAALGFVEEAAYPSSGENSDGSLRMVQQKVEQC